MATEAILGQSFVCLLHVLQHWLHGLATLVTNFADVGPIFKISMAKYMYSFWKDYWYYFYYPYYSYYRDKSPTSIRAISPPTLLKLKSIVIPLKQMSRSGEKHAQD